MRSAAPQSSRAGAPAAGPHRSARRAAETARRVLRAERLLERHHYLEAVEVLAGGAALAGGESRLRLRVLLCRGWALMYLGRLDEANDLFEQGRVLAEDGSLGDAERADATFRLACCRQKLGRVSNAVSLHTVALALAVQSGAGDGLAARILDWRSRCHQLQRDWDAAQADADRSLELAEAVGDPRLQSHALMQCSLVAERRGNTLLARFYAERARTLAVEAGDRQAEARITNNLGGLSALLGEPEQAIAYLKESFALSLDVGNDADAAQAISSLAQVHLRTGELQLAEEQARHALRILADRVDYLDERGSAHIVVGRALLAQGRHHAALAEFRWAEGLLRGLGSASHLAAAWIAQGDALAQSGDVVSAARIYRSAADALQDLRF